MKLFGLVMGALLCTSLAFAGDSRTGLYASVGLGVDGGKVDAYSKSTPIGTSEIDAKGLQNFVVNGKIGFSPIENLAVYGVASEALYMTFMGEDSHSLLYLGGGLSYWLPCDFFVAGSAGTVRFSSDDDSYSDDFGLGFRFSAGKDWRVFPWGSLGLEAFYEHAAVNGGDDWNGNLVGILFNVNYH